MEMTAARLARLLTAVANVSFFCKQDSFAETLIKSDRDGVDCVPVNFSSRTFSISMLLTVRKAVIERGIKNVIFLGASELKTLHFAFLGLDINLVVWHGTTKSSPKRDVLHRLVYSNVAHHVTISDHLLRNIQQIVPLTDKVDFRLITPSQDIETAGVRPLDTVAGEINILHIGRIAAGKGQLDAIRATEQAIVAGYKCKLVMIGENDGNPYAREVTRAIENSPYKDAISSPGFVDDIYRYLQTADIFLFPSAGEGMPGSVVEALHFPLVCLTYDNTVFPEFSKMGFHFHAVENAATEKLGAALIAICANLESEKAAAANNPELARKIFDSKREINQWVEVLV